MILKIPYETHENSGGSWVVNIGERYFNVNKNVVVLLSCLKNSKDYENAYLLYERESGVKLSYESFCYLAKSQMENLGFLGDKKKSDRYSYLTLKLSVVSGDLSSQLGFILAPLFNKFLFLFLLLFTLFFHFLISIPSLAQGGIAGFNPGWALFFLLFSALLHEFGHVSACRKFDIKSKGIGIGFYFIIPIAYSDISGIWMLTKKQRQIVNLAGIYMEMLYASVLGVFGFYLDNVALINISAFIFIISLRSLNPFIRNDGYWILSDLINTPNLMKESMLALQRTIASFFHESEKKGLHKKDLILSLYPIVNVVAAFIFIVFFYTLNSSDIVNFPISLFYFLKGLMVETLDVYFINWNNLLALAFYVFFGRMIFGLKRFITRILTFKN